MLKRKGMKILASDVNATRAVKAIFPVLEEKFRRIDTCLFDHAWLNSDWQPGEIAGTVFFSTVPKFQAIENIIYVALTEVYSASGKMQHKYQFAARPTPKGFSVDVNIDAVENPAFTFEANVNSANEENLNLLRTRIASLQGIFRAKQVGKEINFTFNGQGFKVIRSSNISLSAAASKKYPELKKIVDKISRQVTTMINVEAKNVKSEMPYKAQWILEELIKDLQDRV